MDFCNKAVRDLVWAMGSPHIVNLPVDTTSLSTHLVDPAWCSFVAKYSQIWLTELDAAPETLLHWLSQRRICFEQVYFSSLLEFYVRFCPLLRAPDIVAQQDISAHKKGDNGKFVVMGQLKLISSSAKTFCNCTLESG
jgi:hypothetical protein